MDVLAMNTEFKLSIHRLYKNELNVKKWEVFHKKLLKLVIDLFFLGLRVGHELSAEETLVVVYHNLGNIPNALLEFHSHMTPHRKKKFRPHNHFTSTTFKISICTSHLNYTTQMKQIRKK